jgi:hypothetical protein
MYNIYKVLGTREQYEATVPTLQDVRTWLDARRKTDTWFGYRYERQQMVY